VLALSGCDRLTISPGLLEQLDSSHEPVPTRLEADAARQLPIEKVTIDERSFRWLMNEDAMATDKLSEGIRKFNADYLSLRAYVATQG